MQKRAETAGQQVEPLSKKVHETRSELERKDKSLTEFALVIERLKKEIDVKTRSPWKSLIRSRYYSSSKTLR